MNYFVVLATFEKGFDFFFGFPIIFDFRRIFKKKLTFSSKRGLIDLVIMKFKGFLKKQGCFSNSNDYIRLLDDQTMSPQELFVGPPWKTRSVNT